MNHSFVTKPNAMSELSAWLCYLEQIHPKSIDMGLQRVQTVAERLNVLKPAPYIFTVAGTNGKGTTCRTLEKILLAAGYQVGVYSSPHLLLYTERVRINDQELPDVKHVEAFTHIEQQRQDISLTYFEYATLSALYLFKQANLDVVILEVGLGGRLDATNIVQQDVAVITSIAIDHVDYLGDSRESIGREKAGIFKQHGIAIVGEPDMPASIVELANQKQVSLFVCSPNQPSQWDYTQHDASHWSFKALIKQSAKNYVNLPIPNVPLANAATALAALSYSALNVDETAIITGLQQAQLLGRFQIIQDKPRVIIDVGHNPHAAQYLNRRLAQMIATQGLTGKLRIIIGMLKDKDIAATLAELQADVWYCASLYGERGTKSQILAQYLSQQNDVQQFDSVKDAWLKALDDAAPNDIIVVCGSFLTVAEVLSLTNNG